MTKGKQQKGEKKRRSIAPLQAHNPELGWTKRRGRTKRRGGRVLRNWTVLVGVLIVISLLIALVSMGISRKERDGNIVKNEKLIAPEENDDGIREELDSAETVAQTFLKEADPTKRLKWVLNAEEVGSRLAEYPEEARAEVGEIQKMLGHQGDGAVPVTAFVVVFPTGNLRLLEVIGTPDGPRVDWDAFARYGTASWEDLLSGMAETAVVRVFCAPSSERPEPFGDQGKWTSFRLSSPELPQTTLGFAEVGSVRDKLMKQVILGTPDYRQRFVLEIVRREGKEEPLFEITRCMAVGWILGEEEVEETWEAAE